MAFSMEDIGFFVPEPPNGADHGQMISRRAHGMGAPLAEDFAKLGRAPIGGSIASH